MPISTKLRAFLVTSAFVIVILILLVTIFRKVESEYAQGILTLVLGRMLGYVDAIYNYEFGTTRSSAKKDETIGELSNTAAVVATTAAVVATTAQAVQAADNVIAVPTAVNVAEVAIVAENVTVDTKDKKP